MYFIQKGPSFNHKNELQRAAAALINEYDHVTCGDNIEETLKLIQNQLTAINEKHPRCKSVEISTSFRRDKDKHYYLKAGQHTISYFNFLYIRKSL